MSGRSRLFGIAAVFSGTLWMNAAVADAQCSMCRTLLQTPEAAAIAAALRSGILILLVAPFGAMAMIALALARSRRRIGLAATEDAPTEGSGPVLEQSPQ